MLIFYRFIPGGVFLSVSNTKIDFLIFPSVSFSRFQTDREIPVVLSIVLDLKEIAPFRWRLAVTKMLTAYHGWWPHYYAYIIFTLHWGLWSATS